MSSVVNKFYIFCLTDPFDVWKGATVIFEDYVNTECNMTSVLCLYILLYTTQE